MKVKIMRHVVSLCWVTIAALLLTGCNPTAGATEYEVIYPLLPTEDNKNFPQ